MYEPEFQPLTEFKAGPGDVAKIVCKVRASPGADVFFARMDKDGKPEKIEKKAGDKTKKWDR